MPVVRGMIWSPSIEVPWNRSVVPWVQWSTVVSEVPAIAEIIWVVVQVIIEEVQEQSLCIVVRRTIPNDECCVNVLVRYLCLCRCDT